MIKKGSSRETLLFSVVLSLILLVVYHSGLTHVFDERDASRARVHVQASVQVESDFIEIKAEADCWSCDLCISGY